MCSASVPALLGGTIADMRLVLLLWGALALAACSPPVCNGTNCDCPANTTCEFQACSAATTSCNLQCEQGATCTGNCGPDCNVQCSGERCTAQVGAGSHVQCTSGMCFITCTGACTVQGSANLTCTNGTTMGPTGCE
jgi:hypothetical protein